VQRVEEGACVGVVLRRSSRVRRDGAGRLSQQVLAGTPHPGRDDPGRPGWGCSHGELHVTVHRVQDLGGLLGVLGQPVGDIFEMRRGHVIFPEDRITDHGAPGAVACRFRSTREDRAAEIGEGEDERRIGRAVRA